MNFRTDIQILRGLAVLLVVLFHLEIGGFSSGFLGVDVFFVISGYLMAKLYTPGDKAGFYLKRAKRLLPAYFAVIFLTVLASLIITVPSDFAQVENQTYFALIFSSNIGFWTQNSYFAKAAFNPLLHLWSLGVEIQFYLLVPLIFWLTGKSKLLFFILLVGSLVCCLYLVGLSPKTAFFLTPFRLWQFLIGYGIAMYCTGSHQSTARSVGGMLGLAAVVVIPLIKINGESLNIINGHPGLSALGISLATAAVLAFGIPKRLEHNIVSSGLVKLGEYSYSIYLAHFPLIVLFLYKPFYGTVLSAESWMDTLLLVALIGLVSLALYRLVEKPLRKTRMVFMPSLAFVMATVILVLGSSQVNNLRYTPQQLNIFNAHSDKSEYRCGKVFRIQHPFSGVCNLTRLESPKSRVLLVGDSHSDAIKTVFAEMAAERNIDVYFMVENIPLLDGGTGVDVLLSKADKLGIKHLVLHYRSRFKSPIFIKTAVLEQLIEKAGAAGVTVSFIMPIPIWDHSVPAMLYENIEFGKKLPEKSLRNYANDNSQLIDFIQTVSADNFRSYAVAGYFCNNHHCWMADSRLVPYYFDNHHLTLVGSKELRPVFGRIFRDLAK